MCTAVSFYKSNHYFGRNLDLEYCYREVITITPRNYPLPFRQLPTKRNHYAIIGIATIDNGYPLYYDATNEHGLSIAGLNFPENAFYFPPDSKKDNIAPFELIPWLLCQCQNTTEAQKLLEKANITDIAYNDQFPITPLHWIIADASKTFTLEQTKSGLKIYENDIGILTNNPPFSYHTENLRHYLNLSPYEPESTFSQCFRLTPNSRGIGTRGIPGDLSSPSRFIRAAFIKENSVCENNELSEVNQFFHILKSVEQAEGSVRLESGFEKTVYSSCCNTKKGIYYYTTYENSQITAVALANENLDSSAVIEYPLIRTPQILQIN